VSHYWYCCRRHSMARRRGTVFRAGPFCNWHSSHAGPQTEACCTHSETDATLFWCRLGQSPEYDSTICTTAWWQHGHCLFPRFV